MRARALRLLIAAAISTSFIFGAFIPAAAVPQFGSTELYFPWAPWGVVIEDPDSSAEAGPFYSYLTVQNLGSEPIDVLFEPSAVVHTLSTSLSAYGSATFSAGDIYLIDDEDEASVVGTGIRVTATRQSDDLPAAISGVIRQMSTVEGFIGTTGSEHETVSGYTALSELGIAEEVHLPIVQTNNNWNTLIRATNFHETNPSVINVMFHEAGGGGSLGPAFVITAPGETATFDLRGIGIPKDWVGTAVVTAGVPIGAVAERIKIETNMLLMNVSRNSDQTGDDLYAALIFRDWNSWNTGISIANLAGVENEVTIDFFNVDGNAVHDELLTIPANGMDFVYLPAGDGSPFVGSAIITGSEPFHGVVDEVKYLGGDGDTGHAMSYTLEYQVAWGNYNLAFPLVAKGSGGSGDTSGIQIFNPSEDSAALAITFYSTDGAVEETENISLDGGESITVYTPLYPGISDTFRGSVLIRNHSSSDGGVVAVSNIVNYDVQFDGSASFSATRFHSGFVVV